MHTGGEENPQRDSLGKHRSIYSHRGATKNKQDSQVASALIFLHIKCPSGLRCLFISANIYWAPTIPSELFQGSGGDKELET